MSLSIVRPVLPSYQTGTVALPMALCHLVSDGPSRFLPVEGRLSLISGVLIELCASVGRLFERTSGTFLARTRVIRPYPSQFLAWKAGRRDSHISSGPHRAPSAEYCFPPMTDVSISFSKDIRHLSLTV